MRFEPVAEQHEDRLVAFLTSNAWPFHVFPTPTEAQARAWVASGRFGGAHWIQSDGATAGLINVEDVDDFTPVFDLRVAEVWRGRGVGKRALRWLARHVFETLDKSRVEGHTRADNVAMRRVFASCSWVQEAHHRRSWPDGDGLRHDGVAYALLREDWRSGTTTPVDWSPT